MDRVTIAYSDTFLVSQHDRACNKFLLEINNPSLLISTSCSCLNDKITTLATTTSKAVSGKCPSVSGKCGVSCKSQIIKQRTMEEEERLLHIARGKGRRCSALIACRIFLPECRTASISCSLMSSELIGSLRLGNVWIFVQLIHRPTRTKNQLCKNPNIALLETSYQLWISCSLMYSNSYVLS